VLLAFSLFAGSSSYVWTGELRGAGVTFRAPTSHA